MVAEWFPQMVKFHPVRHVLRVTGGCCCVFGQFSTHNDGLTGPGKRTGTGFVVRRFMV